LGAIWFAMEMEFLAGWSQASDSLIKGEAGHARSSAASLVFGFWYLVLGIWFLVFGSYFFGVDSKRPKIGPVEFTAKNNSSRDSGTSGEAEHAPSRAATGHFNRGE
jgi:hypothetical protein